jgi:hypothetical protein
MSAFCARSKPSHSYFLVMEDHGKRGLEAIVRPEDTRSGIIAKIKSGEYEHIVFIHSVCDLEIEDVTDDLVNEAELELKEEFRDRRAEMQAATFDHARALRNEAV